MWRIIIIVSTSSYLGLSTYKRRLRDNKLLWAFFYFYDLMLFFSQVLRVS